MEVVTSVRIHGRFVEDSDRNTASLTSETELSSTTLTNAFSGCTVAYLKIFFTLNFIYFKSHISGVELSLWKDDLAFSSVS